MTVIRPFNRFYLYYSLLIFFAIPAIVNAQNKFVDDSLDIYIKREMSRWQIPGVAVAIVKDGKVVVSKGYGVKSIGEKGNVDENTLFQIASNSKAFTGTSIAILDYEKRLSLDDKVTRWMPGFKLYDELATREATIRDLLCHRIGLQTFQGDFLNWGSNLSRKDLIDRFHLHKPAYSFRSKWGYCNLAFLTGGEIIPLVTDTSWDDYIYYHFFLPLRMSHTSSHFSALINDNNACKAHTLVDGKIVIIPYADVDNLGPAASINSCVKDLANWLIMNLDSGRFEGKTIVPWEALFNVRSSQMVIREPRSAMNPSNHFSTYGLGWKMEDYLGRKIIHHSGGADGFVTSTCIVPEERLGIIVLTNTDANSFYDALRRQIIDAYTNAPYKNYSELFYQRGIVNTVEENKKINEWKSTVLKKNKMPLSINSFNGVYKNEVYGNATVVSEAGKLFIHFEHHPSLVGNLEYLDDNMFLCTFNDPTYGVKTFPFEVIDGKVKSITISVNDFIDFMTYKFEKNAY